VLYYHISFQDPDLNGDSSISSSQVHAFAMLLLLMVIN
jgi:hypothetical protein